MQYSCTADWKVKTDYLRCNPNFQHEPRYDCVLVDSTPSPFFARLIFLFTCGVGDQNYPMALIQPFDSVYKHRNRQQKDTDLEFLRLRENLRRDSEFISIHSIIRGAVIVSCDEPMANGRCDYFLFDVLDSDMFLRARKEFMRFANILSSFLWGTCLQIYPTAFLPTASNPNDAILNSSNR